MRAVRAVVVTSAQSSDETAARREATESMQKLAGAVANVRLVELRSSGEIESGQNVFDLTKHKLVARIYEGEASK
jgi:hypothetical protein